MPFNQTTRRANAIKRDVDKYKSPNTANSPIILIHLHHSGGKLKQQQHQ